MNQNTSKQGILILGMHRSGTSALAGTLHHLGIHLGNELMPPDIKTNPKGFWENTNIVNFNDRLLLELNSNWDDERELPDNWWLLPNLCAMRRQLKDILHDEFDKSSNWGIKDPRICRLLPFWKKELEIYNPNFAAIIILRNPIEVAKSLKERDSINQERALLLWIRHVLESEKWTRDIRRVFINYEDLITNWQKVVYNINESLKLGLKSDDSKAKLEIDSFLSPRLRHHTKNDYIASFLSAISTEIYELLLSENETSKIIQGTNLIEPKLNEYFETGVEWSNEIHRLLTENKQLKHELGKLGNELFLVKDSYSWKLTQPFREVEHLLNKGRSLLNKHRR